MYGNMKFILSVDLVYTIKVSVISVGICIGNFYVLKDLWKMFEGTDSEFHT